MSKIKFFMNYIFFKLVSILCFNAKNEDAFNRFIELEKTIHLFRAYLVCLKYF